MSGKAVLEVIYTMSGGMFTTHSLPERCNCNELHWTDMVQKLTNGQAVIHYSRLSLTASVAYLTMLTYISTNDQETHPACPLVSLLKTKPCQFKSVMLLCTHLQIVARLWMENFRRNFSQMNFNRLLWKFHWAENILTVAFHLFRCWHAFPICITLKVFKLLLKFLKTDGWQFWKFCEFVRFSMKLRV